MNRRAFFGLIVGAVLGRGLRPAENGFGIRVIRSYNIQAGMLTRFDVLYGWAALRPELACRIV